MEFISMQMISVPYRRTECVSRRERKGREGETGFLDYQKSDFAAFGFNPLVAIPVL